MHVVASPSHSYFDMALTVFKPLKRPGTAVEGAAWLEPRSGVAPEPGAEAVNISMHRLKPGGQFPGFYLPIFLQACLMTVKFPSLPFNK